MFAYSTLIKRVNFDMSFFNSNSAIEDDETKRKQFMMLLGIELLIIYNLIRTSHFLMRAKLKLVFKIKISE